MDLKPTSLMNVASIIGKNGMLKTYRIIFVNHSFNANLVLIIWEGGQMTVTESLKTQII